MEKETNRGRKKKEIDGEFAERLSKLLQEAKEKGIGQDNVARVIGVSRQSLGKWANGVTVPDILDLKKLANYFNVSTDYLLGLESAPDVDKNINSISKFTEIPPETLSKLIYLAKSFPDDMFNDFINNYLEQILDYSLSALAKIDDNNLFNFIIQHGEKGFDLEIKPNCTELSKNAVKNAYENFALNLYSWQTYEAAACVKRFIEKNTDMNEFERNIESMSAELYKHYVEEASENGKHNPKKE